MRDTIKDRAYFEKHLVENTEFAGEFETRVHDEGRDYKKRLGSSYNFFRESSHNAIATYSIGAPVADVKARSVEAIDALELFVTLGQQDVEYFLYGDGGGYSGGFDEWYRLLAWCILFDLPRAKTDIVLDYLVLQMKNPQTATDALVNRMVRYLGYPGQDESEHLLWPDAYAPLYACFKTEGYRDEQLKTFMKGWYRKMGDTYWYENHKNRHNVYFGYWCFEVAAVAKMLDIDDEALKDHPNYPYDARHD